VEPRRSKADRTDRFHVTDLDPARNACNDFAGYANDKWLAANAIPGIERRGRIDVLEERR
jgi:putative endopeptidase